MSAAAGFIAQTVPAQVINVSDVTLFQLAMQYAGDPLQWVAIAALNGLTDPWISGELEIKIPPVFPNGVQSGILEPDGPASLWSSGVFVAPPAPPRSSAQSLDFSQSGNSQYIPLI